MASRLVLFLLSVMLLANEPEAKQNSSSNIIRLGSTLSPEAGDTSWVSNSGLFAFGFYSKADGYAIGIWLVNGDTKKTVVWTANRDDPPLHSNSTVELTTHGMLQVRTEQRIKLLASTSDSEPATSASLLDSGNFVLYGNRSNIIWQSFDHPTDTILGGQSLSAYDEDDHLVSSMSQTDHSSGSYILSMQNDGNLVAYLANSLMQIDDSYWSTETSGLLLDELTLDHRGSLFLDGYGRVHALVNSTYHGNGTSAIYRATLDTDGIFRLYAHQIEGNTSKTGRIVWLALADPCDVKGHCGYNSYCSTIGTNAVCHCYPGFVSSEQSRSVLDCKQNHSKDECEISTELTPMENTYWNDSPYSVIASMKMDACGKACQEDCDCAAVLYMNGTCNKYNLPIRFGRKTLNATATALFKMPSSSTITPNRSIPFQLSPKVLTDSKRNLILILLLILGSISSIFLLSAISLFFIHRRQVHKYSMLSGSTANLELNKECTLRSFSFNELEKSTDSFTEEVGRGSFGAVYRGTICGSNRRIAVKRLERIVEEGEREFRAEITAIARTHHRNLVQLIGFCIEGPRKLLVYEYMSNGSLADLLFKNEMCLSWRDRVRIALDVARGVLYLHEECEVCIIHCNIKPQNILMDEAWTAKISDFGFARLLMPNHSRTTAEVEAKSGYKPPEWQKDAAVSVKYDVYSYGAVLLEIICRRRSIDVKVPSPDEIILSSWVYDCFVKGELNKLVADRDVDLRTLERMVKVGLWCVQEDPNLRPSMKNAILMLEGLKDIPIPPSPAFAV